jgi:phosphoribosylformylglycinamidine synthase
MSFAGNCGFSGVISLSSLSSLSYASLISYLFSEELGLVFEVFDGNMKEVSNVLQRENIPFQVLGKTTPDEWFTFVADQGNGKSVEILHERVPLLRDIWEQTSFELEKRQANVVCVQEEQRDLSSRTSPPYRVTYQLDNIPKIIGNSFNSTLLIYIYIYISLQ